MSTHLLETMLPFAVELRLLDLRKLPSDEIWARIDADRERWLELITAKGDLLLYGGGKKGETAETFNALANAVAHLSFVPGGVTLFGQHWEETS